MAHHKDILIVDPNGQPKKDINVTSRTISFFFKTVHLTADLKEPTKVTVNHKKKSTQN